MAKQYRLLVNANEILGVDERQFAATQKARDWAWSKIPSLGKGTRPEYKLMLVILACRSNAPGRCSAPVAELAADCCCSVPLAEKVLLKLESLGLIKTVLYRGSRIFRLEMDR